MLFPLDLGELSILYAVMGIILLITSELGSSYYRRLNFLIDKKKLRLAAIIISSLFLLTIGLRIYNILSAI